MLWPIVYERIMYGSAIHNTRVYLVVNSARVYGADINSLGHFALDKFMAWPFALSTPRCDCNAPIRTLTTTPLLAYAYFIAHYSRMAFAAAKLSHEPQRSPILRERARVRPGRGGLGGTYQLYFMWIRILRILNATFYMHKHKFCK